DQVERIAEANCGRRLALAGRGRSDCGDEYQFCRGTSGKRADVIERDLCLVPAVWRDRVARDVELFGGDLGYRPHPCGLGDFDIRFGVTVLLVSARHGVSPC